jgi:hypothetical protein
MENSFPESATNTQGNMTKLSGGHSFAYQKPIIQNKPPAGR